MNLSVVILQFFISTKNSCGTDVVLYFNRLLVKKCDKSHVGDVFKDEFIVDNFIINKCFDAAVNIFYYICK
jgi:hypothetical protein